MRSGGLIAALALALPALVTPPTLAEEGVQEDEMVVYGVETGVLSGDPTSSTTSILTDDLAGEQQRLEDVLSEAVGVQIRRFGGPGERSEVAIRGSTSAQVIVLVDGVRMNSEQFGSVDLGPFPIDLIERIEISRGGGSVEVGGGAIGGVINLVTRRSTAEPTTRVSFSGGSFDTFDASLFASNEFGPLEATLGYSGFASDGDWGFARPVFRFPDGSEFQYPPTTRLNNDRQRHALTLSAGGDVGKTGSLRLRQSGNFWEGGEPGPDDGPGPTAGQQLEAREERAGSLTHLEWTATDPTPWRGNFDGSLYFRFDGRRFTDPDPQLEDEPIDSRTDFSTLGLFADDTWSFAHAPGGFSIAHDWTLRVDGRWDALRANDRPDIDRLTGGIAVTGDLHLFSDQVVLAPGLRFDATQGFGGIWVPRLGASWSPWTWLLFKGKVERSFRIPTFDELYFPDKGFAMGNPDLGMERALNADAGLAFRFERLSFLGETEASAAFFYNGIDESIVWLRVSPFRVRPENTGPATALGSEASLSMRPVGWLALSANHTFIDATYDDSGAALPGRPRNEVNVRIALGPKDLWKLVAEYRYTGRRTVSEGGDVWIEPQSTWDLSAAVDLAALPRIGSKLPFDRLWLSFRAANLTDQALRDSLFFPQPGRSLSLGFEAGW